MFETATLLASVLLLTALVQDGNSNWLKVTSMVMIEEGGGGVLMYSLMPWRPLAFASCP